MSHSTPFVQTSVFADVVHCLSPWTGSRPLASATLTILNDGGDLNSSWIACCCPVVMEIPQLWGMLQQFIDGVGVGVDQLKALGLGLGGSQVG
jgi:hypothetical protein